MLKLTKNKKMLIIIGICAMFLLSYFVYKYAEQEKAKEEYLSFEDTLLGEEEKAEESQEIIEAPTEIIVDIKGAVKYPGIYEMTTSDRVHDAILKAGGIVGEGDGSVVNLAMKLADEMVIYVPIKGEEAIEAQGASEPINNGNDLEGIININTANEEELQEIPGIGPSKAKAIMDYRETNGLFSAKEDLKKVSGIGDKTYEKLENSISI